MKFGLSEKHLNYLDATAVMPLKNLGCKVWIFGSRARGDYREYSDVDLLYLEDPAVDISRAIRIIRDELADGTFPYRVDLVNLVEVADSYLAQILADRREIWALAQKL